jgi:catechol 2,3-dioxygenase-like lactoylglutathione lyase family enzyme
VTDIARSTRFYAAFGFQTEAAQDPLEGEWLDKAVGLTHTRLNSHRLTNSQGISLQLLQFERPASTGSSERRQMNQFGLTHLNFYVRDFEATLADVRAYGGQVLEHTRLDTPLEDGTQCSMLFCTDPDGARIEVWATQPHGAGNSMATAIPGVSRKFSHSGICVADVERSLAFYANLGLRAADTFDYRDLPGALDRVSEMEGTRLLAQMMRNEKGDVVELLYYAHPAAFGARERRPSNQYGLTHLAFWVDDLHRSSAALARAGGRVFAESRSSFARFEQMQCADPDGVRIELMKQS